MYINVEQGSYNRFVYLGIFTSPGTAKSRNPHQS